MSAEVAAPRSGQARVCVVSQRGVNRLAAWCSNYEFEDVICSVDDVDLFELRPGAAHAARNWITGRMIWRRGLQQLVPYINPGIQPIALKHDYDLFVYICSTPADLIYLSAIDGWKDRCRKKVCYIVEFFAGWAKELAFHLKLLEHFDHVTFCFSGSVDAAQTMVGRPCHHLPLGVDVLRFSPYPNPPKRCIDVYSMGRRPESAHRALLELAARKEIFYIYDTIPGLLIQPRDHRQHRDLIASCGQRARFFVTYPAKVDVADETRGQSEVGARFYEGAATGAVMIGQAPTVPAFAKDFHWPGAVIDIGQTGESLDAALAPFRADPDLGARLGRRNAIEALRRFDWSYRWKDILRITNLQPSPRLENRLARLNQLATLAETSSAGSFATCQA